jgi:S-DNA-T family DNA segregation ATPase FtsK/SpoIIIE
MARKRRVKRKTTRRKPASKSTRTRKKKNTMKFEVKSSVAREIWAVIYFAIASVTFLSIQGAFGIIGELWVDLLRPILGWGIFIIPPIFLLISLMLFFARNISFGLSKIVGIALLLISTLSIIHLSVPLTELHAVAQAGRFGGYVGFVTNFFMREMLNIGSIGSSVVLVSLALISVLLTFEISLAEIARFFKPEIKVVKKSEKKKKKEKPEEEDELKSESIQLASDDMLKAIYGNSDSGIRIKRARPLNQQESENEDEKNNKPETEPVKKETQEPEEEVEKKEEPPVPEKTETPDYSDWEFPSLDLLNNNISEIESDDELLKKNAEKIRKKLDQFGIEVTMHEVNVGPTVIQYTLKPHEGVKLSKITSLKSDIALALAAHAIRIEAPIPGKSLVGIEVPNQHRAIVHLREILECPEFEKGDSLLKLPFGRDVSGKPIIADLRDMPHMLIAGATGAGKSVAMNSFLISLLYQNSPEDLKMILIDPKRVELREYNGIPHLLTPVITDPEKAAIALRWCVSEMNRRYQTCAEKGKRNITDYNSDPAIEDKMSTIVVVIDELADLMMAAGKEVEASICRIAQMARAVGMHLVIATQRPSVDVITGLIKANIPARVAFAVSSSVDSRTILDSTGAEDLLGKGDMLYLPSGMSKLTRIQGIFISSKEIEKVTNRVKITAAPDYNDEIISNRVADKKVQGIPDSSQGSSDDSLYEDAIDVIKRSRKASASLLQRRLKIGYARAARLLDILEENKVIGPSKGAKPRDIYVE